MGTNLRLCGLLLAVSCASWAVPLCTDSNLQQYINLGSGGCQVGTTLFSNFTYLYNFIGADGSDTPVAAGNVGVALGGSASAPVLTFTGPWQVTNGFQSLLDIGYTVCALNSLGGCSGTPVSPFEGASLTFDASVDDLGAPNDDPSNIKSNLDLFPQGASVIILQPSLYPSACASGCPGVTASASLETVQQLTVGDQFTLDSGGTGSGSANTATLTSFSQQFSDAPEPATLAVVGMGLLGCGLAALRRRKR